MDTTTLPPGDELGPEKIVLVHRVGAGLDAVVVVDNTAAGPAIGGIRLAPDVTPMEVCRLARAMTFKNAAAGLPHGGGKAGIVGDPAMAPDDKHRLLREFAREIAELIDYIPGPDMGIDEACMAHVHDEMGRGVGLPAVLGGIPLDEIGATGFGVAVAAAVAEELGVVDLRGARIVVQGYGAVGRHAARFLGERGTVLVGVSDSRGAVVDRDGLDPLKLAAWKRDGNTVAEYPGGRRMEPDALVSLDCDIWIPAARPDVFTEDNAGGVRARLVLQGANIPATRGAEQILHQRGVLCIPDFIANAGGVICAAVEHAGGTRSQAFAVIEDKVAANTRELLERVRSEDAEPRTVAESMARRRLDEAMAYRTRP